MRSSSSSSSLDSARFATASAGDSSSGYRVKGDSGVSKYVIVLRSPQPCLLMHHRGHRAMRHLVTASPKLQHHKTTYTSMTYLSGLRLGWWVSACRGVAQCSGIGSDCVRTCMLLGGPRRSCSSHGGFQEPGEESEPIIGFGDVLLVDDLCCQMEEETIAEDKTTARRAYCH